MIRSLALLITALVSVSAIAAECPPAELQIKDLALNAEGSITRSVYQMKESDAQKKKERFQIAVAVVRDQVQLEQGDQLVLNASPLAIDALFEVGVALEDKDYDEQGVMSSTYRVRETTYFTFSGIKYKSAEKTYVAKISSNYIGKGIYSDSCGEVVISELVEYTPESK